MYWPMSSISASPSEAGSRVAVTRFTAYSTRLSPSGWQTSTRKRDVKDGKLEDATFEVEQIKAFRDTWRDGIHSYITYLRDRLTVVRDLLSESGSVFVQISDENVSELGLAWSFDLDSTRGVEATPLVIDGVMYTTSTWSRVMALDDAARALLAQGKLDPLRHYLRKNRMMWLQEAALSKAVEGITSIQEIMRALSQDADKPMAPPPEPESDSEAA